MADPKARFVITAEDRASAALRKIRGETAGVSKAFRALTAVIPTAAFTYATKSALNFADKIADTAENTAFSTTKLQELKFAAEQNGVSFDMLSAGLGRFTKRLGLARMGTGAAAETYKNLGVDLSQTNEQVFRQVVATLGSMERETDRLALTTRLFGDDAQRLGVIFQNGNAGLERYAKRAHELGLVLSDELVQGASDANDQLDIMQKVVQTQLVRGLVTLAPVITQIGQAFADAAVHVADFFNELGSVDNLTLENLKERAQGAQKEYARLEEQLARRSEIDRAYAAGRPGDAGVQFGDLFLPSEQEIREKMARAEAVFVDAIQRINTKVSKLSSDTADKGGGPASIANLFTPPPTVVPKIKEVEEAYDDLDRALDLIEAQFSELDEAEARAIAGLEKMNTEIEEQKSQWSELGPILGSAFEDAIVNGGKFSDVIKGIEKDIIRMLTRITITRPLTSALEGALSSFNPFSFFTPSAATVSGPFAEGGIASGPDSGYLANLHGTEAVVPLSGNRSIPVDLSGGMGDVTVNVINNAAGTQANARQRSEGGNRIIDVMIEQVKSSIAGDISRGAGPIPGALNQTYGLNRVAGAY